MGADLTTARENKLEVSEDTELMGADLTTARENKLEVSVQNCLEGLGIFLLIELDVLAFVFRRGVTLASADDIAELIGHEPVIVSGALDRLERHKLIERTKPSRGARFYRILAQADSERKRCLQHFASLLESRNGRLLLARELKLIQPEAQGEELQADTER
jgi:DNA-binding MarR family transcriptional regulator